MEASAPPPQLRGAHLRPRPVPGPVPGPVLCVRHHLESSKSSYEPISQARNEGSEKLGNVPQVTQPVENGGLWPIGAQSQCQGAVEQGALKELSQGQLAGTRG